MQTWRVSLEAHTPLAISRAKATGNQLQTISRIPGATWRGALASHLIRSKGLGADAHRDPEFQALFLSGFVRFGDLRPAGRNFWPMSARGCARHRTHPVLDLLVDAGLERRLPIECAECGAKTVLPRDEYFSWKCGRPEPGGPKRRIAAHTAISARTLRVRDEQFFSTEVLESNERFEGALWCSESAAETVKAALAGDLRVVIGRGGTRGQGHATLAVSPPAATPVEPDGIKRRLIELNACFPPGKTVFACTLRSPCLVYDDWLLARSWVEAQDIAEAAGVADADLAGYDLAASFSRMMGLVGWNAQAQLPKSDVWAVAPGSAFLFVREIGAGQRELEIERLAPILAKAAEGIGERWEEGLGEAVFCDEFHVKQRPQ